MVRVVLYTVFMAFPLPQNQVKTLAKNLGRGTFSSVYVVSKNPRWFLEFLRDFGGFPMMVPSYDQKKVNDKTNNDYFYVSV